MSPAGRRLVNVLHVLLSLATRVVAFLPLVSTAMSRAALDPAAAAAAAAVSKIGDSPQAEASIQHPPPTAAMRAASLVDSSADGVGGSDGSGMPTHLVVLVHGLGGTPEDLTYLKESLDRSGGEDVLVHLARCNTGKTMDGVAEGGSRLAKEITDVVEDTPSLSRISLVGNSLGGLYVRYAARMLYRDDDEVKVNGTAAAATGTTTAMHSTAASETTTASVSEEIPRVGGSDSDNGGGRGSGGSNGGGNGGGGGSDRGEGGGGAAGGGTVAGLKPSVFMTIASPHLGVRSFTYVPVPAPLRPLAGVFVGKTGSDLFLSTTVDDHKDREDHFSSSFSQNGKRDSVSSASSASSTSSSTSESASLGTSASTTTASSPVSVNVRSKAGVATTTTATTTWIGSETGANDYHSGSGTATSANNNNDNEDDNTNILEETQSERGGGDAIVGVGVGVGGGGGETTGSRRHSSLLYRMATSEEFLRPLKAFRWRRVYANRRGDFMVPYATAAFLEPGEGDGSESCAPDRRGEGVGIGIGNLFGLGGRVWGAPHGEVVGVSRVLPTAATAAAAAQSGGGGGGVDGQGGHEEERGEESVGEYGDVRRAGRTAIFARGRSTRNRNKQKNKKEKTKTMEEEMAAGLNSCGWEKVSVEFGGLFPVSHNKICALSRNQVTSAMFGSGKKVMDQAAGYLVSHDRTEDEHRGGD